MALEGGDRNDLNVKVTHTDAQTQTNGFRKPDRGTLQAVQEWRQTIRVVDGGREIKITHTQTHKTHRHACLSNPI